MNIQILQLIEGAKAARGLTVIIDVFRAFSLKKQKDQPDTGSDWSCVVRFKGTKQNYLGLQFFITQKC